jgi:phytanoyl-CoA hydroxylase
MEMMEDLRRDFEKYGFVRIPATIFSLSSAQVTDLQKEFERLFSEEYDTGIYPDEIHWRRGISKENAVREICNGWKASRVVKNVVGSEALGKLAADLMLWQSSRIGQDDCLHKPPNSNAVGFHQDGAYISDNFLPRENNCLTMWIALDDADEENGALQYCPGSHKWINKSTSKDVTESSFHVGDHNDHFQSLRKAASNAGVDVEEAVASVQTIPVKAGQMLVHHQNVWHGSASNQSQTRLRRSLVSHILNGNVIWRSDSKPHYIYGRYFIRGESVPREDFFPFTYSRDPKHKRTEWLLDDTTTNT